MRFEFYFVTEKGTAVYICWYNNEYQINMEWKLATNKQKFYIIHQNEELPETFKTAKDAERMIKYRTIDLEELD